MAAPQSRSISATPILVAMAAPQARPIPATPILVAMAIGALVGWWVGPEARILGFFEFLGTAFINLLKMVVVPLMEMESCGKCC